MKNTKIQAIRLGILLATCAAHSLSAQTTAVLQEWSFNSQANPAAPELSPVTPPAARATVQAGQFASGWLDHDAVLAGGKGIWDLGRKGTITLNQWSLENGPASTSHEITVKVTQWYDGGIYSSFATVDVPGARLANRSQAHSGSGTLGDWITDETHWTIDIGASAEQVVVTSPSNGALIDKVSVEAPVSLVVPTLSIRPFVASNVVEVSWPSANASGWQLESNTTLDNVNGWKPVDGPPRAAGDRLVIALPKEGNLFFRLKHQ